MPFGRPYRSAKRSVQCAIGNFSDFDVGALAPRFCESLVFFYMKNSVLHVLAGTSQLRYPVLVGVILD